MPRDKSRRKSDQRLPLPSVVSPSAFRCLPVPIPYDEADPSVWREYFATFTGQLDRLGYRFNWQHGESDAAYQTAVTWRNIVNQVQQDAFDGLGCGFEQPEESGCIEVHAYHPAIDYWPNHPILSPDANPVGPYGQTCWKTGAGYIFGTGSDAMINPLCYTADLFDFLQFGAPSLTIRFSGIGEVDLHFLSQPQGGWAWVFPDGNPLLGVAVDLSFANLLDLISIEFLLQFLGLVTGQENTEVVHTMEFDTPGDHTITAWFLPSAGIEPPFIGAGGGFRKAQFCGDIVVEEETVTAYTLVQTGCTVELQADGVPVSTISVMTPVPDCVFESQVEIEVDAVQHADVLVLRNIDTTISGQTTNLWFEAPDNAGVLQRLYQLRARWYDQASLTSGIAYNALRAGYNRTVMEIAQQYMMRLYVESAYGDNLGLEIRRVSSTFGFNRMFTIYHTQAGLRLYQVFDNGQSSQTRVHNSATTQQISHAYNMVPDGVTPGAGFGHRIQWTAEDSTTAGQLLAEWRAYWADATHATRSARVDLQASDFGGERTAVSFGASNGQSLLAFHGNAPLTRRGVEGDNPWQAAQDLVVGLHEIGLISDATTYNTPTLTGSSEYQALKNLISILEDVGVVSDDTDFLPDDGSGEGTIVSQKVVVTEVYRDLRLSSYGLNVSQSGAGSWASTQGWASGGNGFRVNRNYDEFRQIIRVRIGFETAFERDLLVTLGFDLTGSNPHILHEEVIPASAPTPVQRSWDYPAFLTNSTVTGIGIHVDRNALSYDSSVDGSFLLVSLDVQFLGLPNLEADGGNNFYPFGTHRVIRYLDPLDIATMGWNEAGGGSNPPALVIIGGV